MLQHDQVIFLKDKSVLKCICIGNSIICSDIWQKYHEWYLCQMSRTNHAIICLYFYPQKVCNFHI